MIALGLQPAKYRRGVQMIRRNVVSPLVLTPARPSRGAEETRTPDFLLAKEALYQLSYGPYELRVKACFHSVATTGP